MAEKQMSEYLEIAVEQMRKFAELTKKKKALEEEIEKVRELASAAYNLVPDEEKQTFSEDMKSIFQRSAERQKGLTETIRTILQENREQWFGPIQIRDRMQESGFDFSGYTSNPLSSIHSVLKRLHSENQVNTKLFLLGTKYRYAGRYKGRYSGSRLNKGST